MFWSFKEIWETFSTDYKQFCKNYEDKVISGRFGKNCSLTSSEVFSTFSIYSIFFSIIGISYSFESYSESIFPFQYIIIFQTYQSLDPSSSTPGRNRHMHPLTFCGKFHSQQLLFKSFFYVTVFFAAFYFPILVYYNISDIAIFGAP